MSKDRLSFLCASLRSSGWTEQPETISMMANKDGDLIGTWWNRDGDVVLLVEDVNAQTLTFMKPATAGARRQILSKRASARRGVR